MYEKVNPMHPDKIADRIAGAIVDYAYRKQENPKIAVEVLVGHGKCTIISETSVKLDEEEIGGMVNRIAEANLTTEYREFFQDPILARNQNEKVRCGDNGIFKGVPGTAEEAKLTEFAHKMYDKYKCDGKYILDEKTNRFVVCQSNADEEELKAATTATDVNPLGYWTGGLDVDTGATNRKLGSDMAGSVTGGGLHGKDLSKADVSINIYAWLKAQKQKRPVEICCAIGDEIVDGRPYSEIVEIARAYIQGKGGFEKFAEWGLID